MAYQGDPPRRLFLISLAKVLWATLISSKSGVPGSRSDRSVASVSISSVVQHDSLRFAQIAVATVAVPAVVAHQMFALVPGMLQKKF